MKRIVEVPSEALHPKAKSIPIVRSDELVPEVPAFVCVYVNKREREVQVIVHGKVAAKLQPGKSFNLEMWSPLVPEARYEKIVFEPRGRITTKECSDWVCPYEGWVIDLINSDSVYQSIRILTARGVEVLGVLDGVVTVSPGIARLVPVDICDPLCRYKSLEWRMIKEKLPAPGMPSYLVEREHLGELKTLRPERDLAKIAKQLEERAVEASHA